MVTYRIDLNCDLGESFGAYTLGEDEQVLNYITSANIACGYHAGDPHVMFRTVGLAKAKGVAIGAHPGFPDLLGFGRREIPMKPEEIYHLVLYQLGALAAIARAHNTKLNHVKPHGALYNMACRDQDVANAIAQAVAHFDENLTLFALSGSILAKVGRQWGLKVAQEVFADRTYQPDGTLTPRTQPNALIHDEHEAARRIIQMIKEGKTEATDGSTITVTADTICVHGDSPKALSFVRQLHKRLTEEGILIKRVGS